MMRFGGGSCAVVVEVAVWLWKLRSQRGSKGSGLWKLRSGCGSCVWAVESFNPGDPPGVFGCIWELWRESAGKPA